jgi:hypothetical protein
MRTSSASLIHSVQRPAVPQCHSATRSQCCASAPGTLHRIRGAERKGPWFQMVPEVVSRGFVDP